MLNYRLEQQAELAFQALGDPSRRGIVAALSRGPASVSDIAGMFGMSLPAIMQHLQVLEESGLVRSTKKGRVRTCWVETKTLSAAELWLAERRTIWEARADRLGDHLKTLTKKEEE